MVNWWTGLSALAQAFFAAAVFFSVIFVWQFFAAVSGLGGEGDVDMDGVDDVFDGAGPDGDLTADLQGLDVFRLLSIRSLLAFALLFSWAAALYLGQGVSAAGAMFRAGLWGVAGMAVVAGFFWLLPRLTEEGTAHTHSTVGQTGEVYIGIPQGGDGQVRVLMGGQVRFVKARGADGAAIAPGRSVTVMGVTDDGTLLVRASE
jgi:hypothetical protein